MEGEKGMTYKTIKFEIPDVLQEDDLVSLELGYTNSEGYFVRAEDYSHNPTGDLEDSKTTSWKVKDDPRIIKWGNQWEIQGSDVSYALNREDCSHKWESYQGFSESYEFCSICDVKRVA
jgi:hypothetical protein